MNNVDLSLLEQKKAELLKKYGLDQKSIEEFKSKIKVVSKEEKTALGKELFELLISKDFDDETDYEKVIELIYNGADIEYNNVKKRNFPLLRCARKSYLKSFIALLKAGANVNQKNNYLTTATMASARHGNKEMLEILILMKADINAKSKDGDNALISARNHHQVDCFYMLVNAGANLSVISQDGRSIYTYPPNEKFESPILITSSMPEDVNKVSFEDTQNLIDEAITATLSINNSEVTSKNEEEQNHPKQKKKEVNFFNSLYNALK